MDAYYKENLNLYYDTIFTPADANKIDFICYYCEKVDKVSDAQKQMDAKSKVSYYKLKKEITRDLNELYYELNTNQVHHDDCAKELFMEDATIAPD